MEYNAVLFDLDGTLLDTIEDIANSMNTALSRLGFRGHGRDEYKYLVGAGIETLVYRALPENHRGDSTVARCLAAMDEEYRLQRLGNTGPYPGIPELLDALQLRGVRMAVLSNKPDDSTRLIVSTLLPRWKFDMVLGSRPSVPLKPDPAAALEIAARVGIAPERFICLGDTDVDMRLAHAARMYPVGALWGYRTAEELLSSGAKVLLGKPGDLLNYL